MRSGQECVVSDGDTLQLRTAPPADATTANLVVLSSKGNPECQISLTVQVQLTDLQEMQNHMRETIDQGLQDLQDKQGKDGLPAAPPSAQGTAGSRAVCRGCASAGPQCRLLKLQQEDQQGDQAEKEVNCRCGSGQWHTCRRNSAQAHPRLLRLLPPHPSRWARPPTR